MEGHLLKPKLLTCCSYLHIGVLPTFYVEFVKLLFSINIFVLDKNILIVFCRKP